MKELLEQILNDPNATIALCAVVISLISLMLSILTAFQNRRNNRLSVRPIAYVLPQDYENKIAVIIQNKGTGPLVSKSIKFVSQDGEERSSLLDFMPGLNQGYYWKTFSKASKIIIRPSEEKVLLEFEGDVNDPIFIEQRDSIRQALSNIQIQLNYKSIFNEYRTFKLKYKLKWFGRHS